MQSNTMKFRPWILATLACALGACGGSASGRGGTIASPAFATGSQAQSFVLDSEGYVVEELVLTTPTGVTLRLRAGTQIRDRTGASALISGPIEIGVDGGLPIVRPDGGPALDGIVRPTVRTASGLVSASFHPEAKLSLEIHDGTLAGHWELFAYAQAHGYVTGTDPSDLLAGEALVEIHQGLVPTNANGPEQVDVVGTGPLGFVFVPNGPAPVSAKPALAIAPPGGSIQEVNFDLTTASQDKDLMWSFAAFDDDSGHLLCTWAPSAPKHWQEGLAVDFTNALGESWAILWHGSDVDPQYREITVRSVFKNRLCSSSILGPSPGGGNITVADEDGLGGMLEENDLDGPYAGPIKIELIGSDFGDVPFTELEYLEGLMPAGARLAIENLKVWGGTIYRAELRVQQHYASVFNLVAQLPDTWKVEADGRELRIRATDLYYDFETDEDGWVFGHGTGPLDKAVRNGRGAALLDGSDGGDETGEPAANAWMTRIIDLPASVTTLTVRVSAHDKAGTDAAFRVSITDIAAGVTVVLHDWEVIETLGSDRWHWVDKNLNIAAYAGKTVAVLIEQDDDGDGAGEQIWIDEVVVY